MALIIEPRQKKAACSGPKYFLAVPMKDSSEFSKMSQRTYWMNRIEAGAWFLLNLMKTNKNKYFLLKNQALNSIYIITRSKNVGFTPYILMRVNIENK